MISDWVEVKRGVKITHDLKTVPLEIKIVPVVDNKASNVDVLFYDSNGKYVGQFYFKFSTPPQYSIYGCNSGRVTNWSVPPNESGTEATVMIRKSGKGDNTKLELHYNNEPAFQFMILSSLCSNAKSKNYYGDVGAVQFYRSDTGSRYYRLFS